MTSRKPLVRVMAALLVAVAAFGGTGCRRHDAGAVVRGAVVQLRLEKREPARLHFAWRFTNHHPFAVFVPATWEHATFSRSEAPPLLLIPPSDVLFAYADLSYCREQLKDLTVESDEGPEPRYWRVGPGESLDGSFEMKLPFRAHEEEEDFWTRVHLLRSVFRYKGGYTDDFSSPDEERQVRLAELTTVWFAIRYSLVNEEGLPEGEEAYLELYRRSVIDQAIRGEKRSVSLFFFEPLAERLVISEPVNVRIPLEKECVLFFEELRENASAKRGQSNSDR